MGKAVSQTGNAQSPRRRVEGAGSSDALKLGSPAQTFEADEFDYDAYASEGIVFHEPEFSENLYQDEAHHAPEDYASEDLAYDEVLGTQVSVERTLDRVDQGDPYDLGTGDEFAGERTLAETELTGTSEFSRHQLELDVEDELLELADQNDLSFAAAEPENEGKQSDEEFSADEQAEPGSSAKPKPPGAKRTGKK